MHDRTLPTTVRVLWATSPLFFCCIQRPLSKVVRTDCHQSHEAQATDACETTNVHIIADVHGLRARALSLAPLCPVPIHFFRKLVFYVWTYRCEAADGLSAAKLGFSTFSFRIIHLRIPSSACCPRNPRGNAHTYEISEMTARDGKAHGRNPNNRTTLDYAPNRSPPPPPPHPDLS